MKRQIPCRRFAQPDEIAMAALYLTSGAAGMVNGENLVVDGGFTIRQRRPGTTGSREAARTGQSGQPVPAVRIPDMPAPAAASPQVPACDEALLVGFGIGRGGLGLGLGAFLGAARPAAR